MTKKAILVTGADGQLGNAIRASSAGLPFRFVYSDMHDMDITNAASTDQYLKSHKVHYCINCAAYTQVDAAEDHQEEAYSINVRGVENLARSCQVHRIVLLHVSTDFVFDGFTNVPYKESSEANPINTYGVSKLNGELMALGNCEQTLVVRTSWLYSSYGHNFLKAILRLGAEREALNVVYDQIGSPTYADDLAAALLKIIAHLDKDPGFIDGHRGVYHFANAGVCSWYDLAVAICELKGLDVEVRPVHTEAFPTAAKRPRFSVLDTEKIRDVFGLEIPHWRDGVRRCLKLL